MRLNTTKRLAGVLVALMASLGIVSWASAQPVNGVPDANTHVIDLGSLTSGATAGQSIYLDQFAIWWFKFTVPAIPVASGPGNVYLDIRTTNASGNPTIPTYMALFNSAGNFAASGGSSTQGSFNGSSGPGTSSVKGSMLSYGATCPTRPDAAVSPATVNGAAFFGQGGNGTPAASYGLAAGTYYLCVIRSIGSFGVGFVAHPQGFNTTYLGNMDVEIKLGTTGNAPPSVTSSSLVGDSGATALLTTVATNNCTLGSDLPNSVRIDLSGIGGSSTQAMYDDGTHGDVAGLNNTWSFSTTLPVVPGVYVLPGVATNSFGVSSNFTITAVVRGSVQLVVISQVNGTGLVQGSWAGPNVNFVEVHNTGSAAADMSGYAVQSGYYDSYYGTTTWVMAKFPGGFTIPAGKYAMVQLGTPNPSPPYTPNYPPSNIGYFITPDVFGVGNSLIQGSGKVALTRAQLLLSGAAGVCPGSNSDVVDWMGYGSTDCSEVGPAPAESRFDGKSLYRECVGTVDTNNNVADFTLGLSSPRNLSSPANMGSMTAVGAPIESDLVSAMQTTPVLITASAGSCSGAPSGVQFHVDLSGVGGSSTQAMYDDGTHGDAVAGDGVFSIAYTIPDTVLPAPVPSSPTMQNRPWIVPIVGTDAFGRTAPTYAAFFVTIAPTGACCIHGQGVKVRTSASCLAAGGSYLGDGSSPLFQHGTVYTTGNTTIFPDQVALTPGIGSDTLTITDTTIVRDLVVNVVLNHAWSGDIIATLSNGTTTVPLFSRPGFIGSNNVGKGSNFSALNTVSFINGGGRLWNEAYGNGNDSDYIIRSGFYAPSGAQEAAASFAPFIGAPIAGNWTLTMTDNNANFFAGFFTWSLEVNPISTCCKGDYNGDGNLSIQDIFDFLNGWFSGNPRADFNGNGLAVQDIFDFLNAWFAGC